MDSTRLNKINRLLQKELGEIFQRETQGICMGSLVSVSGVRITSDLSVAKVFISIFPPEKRKAVFENIEKNSVVIRNNLAQRIKLQIRRIPELEYMIDDSLDHAQRIEELLKS